MHGLTKVTVQCWRGFGLIADVANQYNFRPNKEDRTVLRELKKLTGNLNFPNLVRLAFARLLAELKQKVNANAA